MNTKINHEYASNSYNGGIVGSDSPAALLDMLAEVASQTLHSEKKRSKSLLASQCKSKTDYVKRKTHESSFNVPQLLSMPASQLVKQFSIFTSDELKRQYSYTCALVVGCGQKYTSFASEGRARMSIKAHLAEHLEYLKTNKDAYKTFTAKSVSYKNYKTSPQNKKNRLQQLRKPQETLNKENKNVITEKSTNYLRNILLSDSTFKELDKNKNVEKVENPKKLHNSEQKDTDRIDFKVLGDHSYFERLKDEIPNKKDTSSVNNILENATDENIVLMVVGTDSVHMKEYPHINKELSEKVNKKSEAIYFPEISWSTESGDKNIEIATTKPKGKAKFIGTSKEEREMALAFMDRIKKKGNPTGNNLECRICNPPRSFTAPTTLVSHYRSHAGIKPYECRICRAVFTRRHSLKYHMLIHQNQTRFTCADCGKKFRHPSHFREHRRRHTGEAPFGCDDCGQRFKTRNTYKRHLKTRHGKVLTTTGELLYLSEEDFQKVRTNRKKKNDVNKDHMIDENVIAAKTIMHYQNDNDEMQNTATGEYIINNDTTDSDKHWESNDTIQIIKNCFETYEVCSESHLNKTDPVETEIPIVNNVCNQDKNSLPDEYADKVQDKSPQLQNTSYNKLEVVHDENNRIICHDNAGQSEIIYHNINETPSYIKVEYSNLVNDIENGNNLEFQENFKLLEHQIKNHIQIINNTEDYFNDASNNSMNKQQIKYVHNAKESQTKLMQVNTHIKIENENNNKHIIFTQEETKYEKQNNDITILDCNSYEEMETHEIAVSEDLIDSNTSEVNQATNKTLSTITDTLLNQNENCTLQEDKKLGNYQTIITNLIKNQVISSSNYIFQKDKKPLNQTEQRLYIRNEPLSNIIVQNKYINILPQHFSDQPNKSKIQLNKGQKFTFLNKHMQAINIKQNGNQNTILLLTNNALQNNVFKADQNNTADNE
ncbi:PREDICTED: myoneurin-like, partial [Habropoda laboriosa]|uniref:myoneurin-like n=1 Tax=Habropoda laboriosa TaxID=597456 RepID=UPI00083E0AC5